MKSGRTFFAAGIQVSGHEAKNSRLRKLPNPPESNALVLSMLEDFEKRGINLKSLTEPIDTSTAMGKAFYGIAAVFAELFRSINKENQRAGIEAAKRGESISGDRQR